MNTSINQSQSEELVNCDSCNGTGSTLCPICSNQFANDSFFFTCRRCDDTGISDCRNCNGTGLVKVSRGSDFYLLPPLAPTPIPASLTSLSNLLPPVRETPYVPQPRQNIITTPPLQQIPNSVSIPNTQALNSNVIPENNIEGLFFSWNETILRFYSDGLVLSADIKIQSITNNRSFIYDTISRSSANGFISRGDYHIQGENIEFDLFFKEIVVSYVGKFLGNKLILDRYNHVDCQKIRGLEFVRL